MNRFTHFLFTSGFPRMACSVAPKSVHLNCGKVNVDRRGAARSSMQLKARMLQIALDPSTHPLPTSGLSITARSSLQLFFLVAAEAFTELECEGKEVPSLARESRTARGNNLNDAGLQGEYTNGYK
jgi:hypothetical protein